MEKLLFFPGNYPEYCERADTTPGWDSCPNLEDIFLMHSVKHREVEAIFNSPKLSLKYLHLSFSEEITDPARTVNAIVAGGITSLESVIFNMRLPQPNTFDKLVQMNKSLRKAQIAFEKTKDVDKATLIARGIEVTRCFLNSQTLKYLEISERWHQLERNTELEQLLTRRVSPPARSRLGIRKILSFTSLNVNPRVPLTILHYFSFFHECLA